MHRDNGYIVFTPVEATRMVLGASLREDAETLEEVGRLHDTFTGTVLENPEIEHWLNNANKDAIRAPYDADRFERFAEALHAGLEMVNQLAMPQVEPVAEPVRHLRLVVDNTK